MGFGDEGTYILLFGVSVLLAMLPLLLPQLPLDLFLVICQLISAADGARLWLTGNAPLQARLSIGFEEFVDDELRAWPAFLGSMSGLRRCTIGSFSRYVSPFSYLPRANVAHLSNKLSTLNLNFRNALSHLLLLPEGATLAALFPSLKELAIGEQFVLEFSHRAFLESLPVSLIKLSLPSNVAFDVDSILAMPCLLEGLEVVIHPVLDGEEARVREAPLFSNLAHFLLQSARKVNWIHMIPPSVVKFRWLEADSDLTMNEIIPESVLAPKNRPGRPAPPAEPTVNPTASDFALFPRGLTNLRLPWSTPATLELLTALPRTLTELHYSHLSRCANSFPAFAELLPPALTRLSTFPVDIFFAETDLLPKQLKSWWGSVWIFSGPSFNNANDEVDGNQQAGRIAKLPPHLDQLRAIGLGRSDIARLPPGITDLHCADRIGYPLSDMTGLSKQLPSLTRLVLAGSHHVLQLRLFEHLPPTLKTLRVASEELYSSNGSGFEDTIASKWPTVWPKTLESFSLEVERRHVEFSAWFWDSFPPSLTRLVIELEELHNFPSNMTRFPRQLRFCIISAEVRNEPSPLIGEDFFNGTPPSLTSLSLDGFAYNLSALALTALPKGFVKLQLEAKALFAGADIRGCLVLPKDMEAWDLRAKLPPSLVMAHHGFVPEYFIELAKHDYDDMVEDLPTVAFDSNPTGAPRPFGTTRRRL